MLKRGYVLSTVATDVLVLKHQTFSNHNADLMFIVLDQFHADILQLKGIIFLKNYNNMLKKCR